MSSKAKLEYKLHHAKHDPGPLFDLSECELDEVPVGVYTWCKVCRKEVLHLQNNKIKCLSSGGSFKDLALLQVIDLSQNKLSSIPDEMGFLSSLKHLNLRHNRLSSLPKTFSNLKSLENLNISENRFRAFPVAICSLPKLVKLDITGNAVSHLPLNLVDAARLKDIALDVHTVVYPTIDVLLKGTEAIMTFLCTAQNRSLPTVCPENDDSSLVSSSMDNISRVEYPTEDNWLKYAKLKENKSATLVSMEQELQNMWKSLSRLTEEAQIRRQLLVEDMNLQKDAISRSLSDVQSRLDEDKKLLVAELTALEAKSELVISQLLQATSGKGSFAENWMKVFEEENKNLDELFAAKFSENEELRRQEVLDAMQASLEQDSHLGNHVKSFMEGQQQLAAQALQSEAELEMQLRQLVSVNDEHKSTLISDLLNKEELQKHAFLALLCQKDRERYKLQNQIFIIEKELRNITNLEIKKRQISADCGKSLLEGNRIALTQLLMQLLEARAIHEKQLQERLFELEASRDHQMTDFWLRKYQWLMDTMPEVILNEFLDDGVSDLLVKAGAKAYLPAFAMHKVNLLRLCTMTVDDLAQLGVKSTVRQMAILDEVKLYKERTRMVETSHEYAASAPLEMADNESNAECVICMDQKCALIFLDCGHVCCCDACSATLTLCPLCRAQILRKVKLYMIN